MLPSAFSGLGPLEGAASRRKELVRRGALEELQHVDQIRGGADYRHALVAFARVERAEQVGVVGELLEDLLLGRGVPVRRSAVRARAADERRRPGAVDDVVQRRDRPHAARVDERPALVDRLGDVGPAERWREAVREALRGDVGDQVGRIEPEVGQRGHARRADADLERPLQTLQLGDERRLLRDGDAGEGGLLVGGHVAADPGGADVEVRRVGKELADRSLRAHVGGDRARGHEVCDRLVRERRLERAHDPLHVVRGLLRRRCAGHPGGHADRLPVDLGREQLRPGRGVHRDKILHRGHRRLAQQLLDQRDVVSREQPQLQRQLQARDRRGVKSCLAGKRGPELLRRAARAAGRREQRLLLCGREVCRAQQARHDRWSARAARSDQLPGGKVSQLLCDLVGGLTETGGNESVVHRGQQRAVDRSLAALE